MKPSRWSFWERKQSRKLGVEVCNSGCGHEAGGRAQGGRRAPTLVGPMELHRRTSFAYIYSYTLKHHGEPRTHFSTAATFCTREIPSWGLFRRSSGGGIDQGGLLHQHHSLSDEAWVVYHRPSGPQLLGRWLLISLFDYQYKVLLDVLGDLFDVIFFCGVFIEIRRIVDSWLYYLWILLESCLNSFMQD